MGFQRFLHLMSLTVMISTMARQSCASRCWMRRSVLRRSCPKFDSQELVRSTVQRIPRGVGSLVWLPWPQGRFLAHIKSVMPTASQRARTALLS